MEIAIGIIIFFLLLLSYAFYTRSKIYKQVDKLESWKIDIMNRHITDEMAEVKQLNLTGQAETMFENWRKEWDDIVTTVMPEVEEWLLDSEDFADKYRFKMARQVLRNIEAELQDVENSISRILSELDDLVSSEEKNRSEIVELEKDYRECKKSLLANRHTFGKAELRLEVLLDEAKQTFELYSVCTDEGNYLKAREHVKSISDTLTNVKTCMEQIPQLLHECQVILPNQLDNISNGHEEMLQNGYVLDHIPVKKEIETMQKLLEQYEHQIIKIDIEPVKEGINEIKDKIELLYDLLEKEVVGRHYVNNEFDKASEKIHMLQEYTNDTRNELNYVLQGYHLSEEKLEDYRQMEKEVQLIVNRFTQLHGKVEQDNVAYSALHEELKELEDLTISLIERLNEFKEMLVNLRKDELVAREQIAKMRKKLLESKHTLERSNLPGIPDDYKQLLSTAKDALLRVSHQLEQKPLNMTAVHQLLEEASLIAEKVTDTTNEMIEQVLLVEQVIQYANRYRRHDVSVAIGLSEAENAFRQYNYHLALEQAAATLEKIEPGALKRVEEILKGE
ncbi:septation ring formation regulator EzrA [Bacillus sp. HMF5848]|uniref:septation ring formation regulator EzrA n=1 Tax=Bacillus sp. HMF5848 TaxID=2495421 RepID=UPI00163A6FEC|nr:septation ring formation regulator EzrA [Bacillus sp. HMF5848]